MKNRFTLWLLLAISLVAVPFWWLLIDAGQDDRANARPKPVHITELRQLAAAIPGQHPIAVTFTLLAARQAVGEFYAAGIGLKRRSVAVVAWSLPVPGKGPIIIDPGAPPALASVGQFNKLDRHRQSLVDAEAKVASLILHTQDNIGGPPPLPEPRPASAMAQAIAPGVVVIPASSHVPGARLIFVQLADGQEFLFAGNIATFRENWSQLRARSHLAAYLGPPQDRAETYAWLLTIRQLGAEAPKMKIVPGHDYMWLVKQWTTGAIAEMHLDPASKLPIALPKPARTH